MQQWSLRKVNWVPSPSCSFTFPFLFHFRDKHFQNVQLLFSAGENESSYMTSFYIALVLWRDHINEVFSTSSSLLFLYLAHQTIVRTCHLSVFTWEAGVFFLFLFLFQQSLHWNMKHLHVLHHLGAYFFFFFFLLLEIMSLSHCLSSSAKCMNIMWHYTFP